MVRGYQLITGDFLKELPIWLIIGHTGHAGHISRAMGGLSVEDHGVVPGISRDPLVLLQLRAKVDTPGLP